MASSSKSLQSIGLTRGRSGSNESLSSVGGEDKAAERGIIAEYQEPTENLFDACAFFILCPHHKKVVITTVGRKLWLPYVELKVLVSWRTMALASLFSLLSDGSHQLGEENQPFEEPVLISLLRVQLPHNYKYVLRLIYKVVLKSKWHGTWKCCQDHREKKLQWVHVHDLYPKTNLWGSEPSAMARAMLEDRLIFDEQEFSADDALIDFRKGSAVRWEEELVRGANFTVKNATKLYGDFLLYSYPCFTMTITSFREFMVKLGWTANDPRLVPCFNAFNYKSKGSLDFSELLHGLAAFEGPQAGTTGEFRTKCIFRFYDEDNDGVIHYPEFKKMVNDIALSQDQKPNERALEEDSRERWSKLGLKPTDTLSISDFLEAVGKVNFRGTSKLFRFQVNTKLMTSKSFDYQKNSNSFVSERNRPSTSMITERRKYKGVCLGCKAKKYAWAVHSVAFDGFGQQGAAYSLELSDTEVNFKTKNSERILMRAYSKDTLFNDNSVPNKVFNILRNGFEKRRHGTHHHLLTDAKLVLDLCREAEAAFSRESRLLKLSSPCVIFGEIKGSLSDLMKYEKIFWRLCPSLAPTGHLFLGDYVDGGEDGLECICYLLVLKLLAPEKVFLLRGQHEVRTTQKKHTFHKECVDKLGARGEEVWEAINKLLDRMPIAATIDSLIYCVNGGLAASVSRVEELLKVPSPLSDLSEQTCPQAWESLWNEPLPHSSHKKSELFVEKDKGHGQYFTETAVDHFFEVNGLTHMIRSDSGLHKGWKFNMGFKVTSVCSSTSSGHKAAAILADSERLRVLCFE